MWAIPLQYYSSPDKFPLCKSYVYIIKGEKKYLQDHFHSGIGYQKILKNQAFSLFILEQKAYYNHSKDIQVRPISFLSSDVGLPNAEVKFFDISRLFYINFATFIRVIVVFMAIVAIVTVLVFQTVKTILTIMVIITLIAIVTFVIIVIIMAIIPILIVVTILTVITALVIGTVY